MRIIKAGTPMREVFRGKCYRCGCEFECEKHETSTVMRSVGYGNFEHDAPVQVVKCPTQGCGEEVQVMKERICL